MTDTPIADDTQLQVILVDELRPGDVIIVKLKEKLPTMESWAAITKAWQDVFPGQKVILNDAGAFDLEITRPANDFVCQATVNFQMDGAQNNVR